MQFIHSKNKYNVKVAWQNYRGMGRNQGWVISEEGEMPWCNGQRLVEEQLANWTVRSITVAILSLYIMKQITIFQGVAVGRYESEKGGEREIILFQCRTWPV